MCVFRACGVPALLGVAAVPNRHYIGHALISAGLELLRAPPVCRDFTGTIPGTWHYSTGTKRVPRLYLVYEYTWYLVCVNGFAANGPNHNGSAADQPGSHAFIRLAHKLKRKPDHTIVNYDSLHMARWFRLVAKFCVECSCLPHTLERYMVQV